MAEKRNLDVVVARLESSNLPTKRRFLPNVRKALDKQTVSNEKPSKSYRNVTNPNDSAATHGKQPAETRRPFSKDDQSRYVQSYSIFESGIGCVVKTDKNAVELREARPSKIGRVEAEEFVQTESRDDPLDNPHAFVSDIKQLFKDPPVIMKDSAIDSQPPIDPLKEMDLSKGRSNRVPFNFFKDSDNGKLFTLQIPDKILSTDPEALHSGRFGKIQILDNQQVRLVVGGACFDLICPNPLPINSDVVIAEQLTDESVRLNCMGHLEQCMLAVPDLDQFVRRGQ